MSSRTCSYGVRFSLRLSVKAMTSARQSLPDLLTKQSSHV